MDEVLKLLCSSAKLDRDRGLEQLRDLIDVKATDCDFIGALCSQILQLLGDSNISWESKHGALTGAKSILLNVKLLKDHDLYASFHASVLKSCFVLLEDDESRVRLAAGATTLWSTGHLELNLS